MSHAMLKPEVRHAAARPDLEDADRTEQCGNDVIDNALNA